MPPALKYWYELMPLGDAPPNHVRPPKRDGPKRSRYGCGMYGWPDEPEAVMSWLPGQTP